MKKLFYAIVIVVLFAALFVVSGYASPTPSQATCPDGGGWTKIDSDDLSLYPVDGATEYCFKAGSDNSQGCVGGLFETWPQPEGTCGLSHWSYFVPSEDPTATPTSTPTDTPISTPTDPEDPTATPTGTITDQPTPTQTPQETLPPTGGTGVEVEDVAWEIQPGVWAVHASVPGGYTLALWAQGYAYDFEGMRVQVLGEMLVNPTDTWVLDANEEGELLLVTCNDYNAETGVWNKRLVLTVKVL